MQAGTAEQPIFLPHLQEPTLTMQLQPPRIMDQVRTEPMEKLIQKSKRPELPPIMPPCGRGPQRMRGWAGRPRGRQPDFYRPPFVMQFARTMSDWTSTPPPASMLAAKYFAERLEAARWLDAERKAVSQTRGGFRALSGLGYKLTVSVLPVECTRLQTTRGSEENEEEAAGCQDTTIAEEETG